MRPWAASWALLRSSNGERACTSRASAADTASGRTHGSRCGASGSALRPSSVITSLPSTSLAKPRLTRPSTRLRMVRRHQPVCLANDINPAGNRATIIRRSWSRWSRTGMPDAAAARPAGVRSHLALASHFGPHVRPASASLPSLTHTQLSLMPVKRLICGKVAFGLLANVPINRVLRVCRSGSADALPPLLMVKGFGPRLVRMRLLSRRSSSTPFPVLTTPFDQALVKIAQATRLAMRRRIFP